MRILLLLLAALALAMRVKAHHCTTWSTSTTNDETIVLDTGRDGLFGRYVVNDLCNVPRVSERPSNVSVAFGHEFARVPVPVTAETSCLFSIWLYHESNGIDGLQRGDRVVDDTCHWMIESDVFVW